MPASPTSRARKAPACGTCRKRCRRCDRTRPACKTCQAKNLHCEGYPPRFRFIPVVAPQPPSPSSASLARDQSLEADDGQEIQHEQAATSEPEAGASRDLSTRASDPLSPRSPSLSFSIEAASGLVELARPSSNPAVASPSQTDDAVHILSSDQDITRILSEGRALMTHFEKTLVMELGMPASASESPFGNHVLPLAHQYQGVLHALLGLSACHMGLSRPEETGPQVTTLGLQHRADALASLGLLLLKEESQGLTAAEEELVLAMAVLLVFHDICESGVSSHGAHLTGMAFLCARIASPSAYRRRTTASMFFLVTLAWLDMLRGFSGAEKLAYSDSVRKCVRDHGSLHLQTFIGCHPSVFYQIGLALEAARAHHQGGVSTAQFQATLDETETFLRGWDAEQAVYPSPEPEWRLLADAYRHACLLRTMRWPDTFARPCTDERIQASVVAILDIAATIPSASRFYKRLLFPLFMAGADAASPHQMHYVRLCIEEIKRATGIPHHALTRLLGDVWDERRTNPRGLGNVPWMEFTCSFSTNLPQHAYLFF